MAVASPPTLVPRFRGWKLQSNHLRTICAFCPQPWYLALEDGNLHPDIQLPPGRLCPQPWYLALEDGNQQVIDHHGRNRYYPQPWYLALEDGNQEYKLSYQFPVGPQPWYLALEDGNSECGMATLGSPQTPNPGTSL